MNTHLTSRSVRARVKELLLNWEQHLYGAVSLLDIGFGVGLVTCMKNFGIVTCRRLLYSLNFWKISGSNLSAQKLFMNMAARERSYPT
ncbi:MAG: hypothetical protein KME29_02565 [Calothrix sp. FI2-JRJ7]|nr:hypothetical protein [Calothrix sp. FI2-JRJ7]